MEKKNINADLPILLTVDQCQAVFQMGRTKTYQLLNSEGFPSIKVNRRIYVPLDKLNLWIEQNVGKEYLL